MGERCRYASRGWQQWRLRIIVSKLIPLCSIFLSACGSGKPLDPNSLLEFPSLPSGRFAVAGVDATVSVTLADHVTQHRREPEMVGNNSGQIEVPGGRVIISPEKTWSLKFADGPEIVLMTCNDLILPERRRMAETTSERRLRLASTFTPHAFVLCWPLSVAPSRIAEYVDRNIGAAPEAVLTFSNWLLNGSPATAQGKWHTGREFLVTIQLNESGRARLHHVVEQRLSTP